MTHLDQLLGEEMSRCLERIAASYGDGTLAFMTVDQPDLRRRLEEVEARLADARSSLFEHYGAWEVALVELEDVWALAAFRKSGPGLPGRLPSAA